MRSSFSSRLGTCRSRREHASGWSSGSSPRHTTVQVHRGRPGPQPVLPLRPHWRLATAVSSPTTSQVWCEVLRGPFLRCVKVVSGIQLSEPCEPCSGGRLVLRPLADKAPGLPRPSRPSRTRKASRLTGYRPAWVSSSSRAGHSAAGLRRPGLRSFAPSAALGVLNPGPRADASRTRHFSGECRHIPGAGRRGPSRHEGAGGGGGTPQRPCKPF